MHDDLDFFSSPFGNLRPRTWRSRRTGWLTDIIFDTRLRLNRSARNLQNAIDRSTVDSVLIVGIEVPSRKDDIHRVIASLSRTRHRVEAAVGEMGNRGKFENINLILGDRNLDRYDWIIIIDDDMTTPPGLLDQCIFLSRLADLRLFQPAHKFQSYAAFELSHRQWNSFVRITHFAEIGPMTGFHKSTFSTLLPFPPNRMGYGLDVYWSELCRSNGWNVGIVDALPIRHLRPVARSYGQETAIQEGRELFRKFGIDRAKEEILRTVKVYREI